MTPGRFARAFFAFLAVTAVSPWCGPDAAAQNRPEDRNLEVRRTTVTPAEALYRRTVPLRSPSGLQFRVAARGDSNSKPPSAQITTENDPVKGAKIAEEHYREVARHLGFGTPDRMPSLDALLAYCGYAGLSASDVERLEPLLLMDPERLPAAVSDAVRFQRATAQTPLQPVDILSTRFFSPKTTDVSHKVEPVAYSWRKLVRLRVRPGSPAAEHGAAGLWVLTVRYQPDLTKNPFDPDSDPASPVHSYFQAIVTRTKDADWPWPLCWFAFGPTADGAKRQDYSETSWDAGDPRLTTSVSRKYYVPISCVQCHGGDTRGAKLQYLDSDHWIDRVQANDDFPAVGRSDWPALFDEGLAPPEAHRQLVYDVLRQLNAEILEQNELADAAGIAAGIDPEEVYEFQTRAAANWLRLHERNSGHIPPHLRGIPSADRQVVWSSDDPTVQELLPLLNRYCFRCHSSVAYHVFDKSSVLKNDRIGTMISYLGGGEYPAEDYDSMRMPQDRLLKDDHPDRKRMVELLEKVRVAELKE